MTSYESRFSLDHPVHDQLAIVRITSCQIYNLSGLLFSDFSKLSVQAASEATGELTNLAGRLQAASDTVNTLLNEVLKFNKEEAEL